MPKYDIHLKPGEELPTKLHEVLKDIFSEKDFEKLSKFGGRIQISLAAPFTDRTIQDKNVLIDSALIIQLQRDNLHSLEILKKLTKHQLEQVAKLLDYPINSKATIREIRKGIYDFLNSSDKWARISGT